MLARPWSEPLADFAVEEFLALHGLFTRDARDGGEIDDDASSPLGNSEETETARVRMRHSTGPSPVKRPMSEAVASRIGSRLVAGTLHEILCEGRDRETLRRAIVALEKAERGKTDDAFYSRRPHALLMRFPGATTANGGGPLVALGAKARKKWLRSCVAGTWLDPANDDETDGCGSREKSANARASRDVPRFDERPRRARTHACVAWVETRRAFCLTRPVAAEAALRYVRACTPKTKTKTKKKDGLGDGRGDGRGGGDGCLRTSDDDDEREPRNEEHRAAPAAPALAAVVANLARIESHSLTFDPFAGTGGLLAPAIALGAPFALGADVHVTSSESRSLPGREESDFGELGERLGDFVVANAHASPLRKLQKKKTATASSAGSSGSFLRNHEGTPRSGSPLFDAIVCDPPYGLRAPRIVSGSAVAKDALCSDAAEMERATNVACMRPVFLLTEYALRVGGRLVFLAPTHRSKREARVFGAAETRGDRGADLARRRARRAKEIPEMFPEKFPETEKPGNREEVEDAFSGLRFVGACAQEFKGMTRSARVFERIA